jgi:hypothetical protein
MLAGELLRTMRWNAFLTPRIAAVWGGKVSVGTLRIIRF